MRCVSLVLLAMLGAAAAVAVGGNPAGIDENSPAFKSIMSEIDSQVERGVSTADPIPNAPRVVQPPTGSSFLPPEQRFRATDQETVSALNSLDIKSGAVDATKPAVAEKHERNVVAAFASIALETMHRAQGAIQYLRDHHVALENNVKIDAHNYLAWIQNTKARTSHQISLEIERIGKLTDEVSHLELVLQDAVSKDRSYQVQMNELISERQLQRTPPLMPVVAASALTEQQFEAAMAKLADYRKKAQQVVTQTTKGIQQRKILIEQGTKWVGDSKAVLQKWEQHQMSIYGEHVGRGAKAVKESTSRIAAIERILQDSTKFHEDYLNAIARLDIEARIASLETAKTEHLKLKPADEYEDARIKSFVAALQLEIDGLQKKLKEVPGDAKVVPPPPVWGILAQYKSFSVIVPHIAPPAFPAGEGTPVYDASFPFHAAYHGYEPYKVHDSVKTFVPTQAEQDIVSPVMDTDMYYSLKLPTDSAESIFSSVTEPGVPSELSAEASSEASTKAASFVQESASVRAHNRMNVPAPPSMPDLPAPPHALSIL